MFVSTVLTYTVKTIRMADVVLLKTESKERAYVNTVDTCMHADLSRTFQILDEKPSISVESVNTKDQSNAIVY